MEKEGNEEHTIFFQSFINTQTRLIQALQLFWLKLNFIKVQTIQGFDQIKVIKPNICICARSANKRERLSLLVEFSDEEL